MGTVHNQNHHRKSDELSNNGSATSATVPEKTILEETFYVLRKKHSVFKVKLTQSGLHLIKETENHVKESTIPIKDVIGCRCLRSKKQASACACQALPRSTVKPHLRDDDEQLYDLCDRPLEHPQVVDDTSDERDDSDVSAYLYVYAYTLQCSPRDGEPLRRVRTIITLRFRSFDRYDDNYREAQRWRTAIKTLLLHPESTTTPAATAATETPARDSSNGEQQTDAVGREHGDCPLAETALVSTVNGQCKSSAPMAPLKDTRKLLVVCNPKSGPGKGKSIFQDKIVPILKEAEIPYDLHITKRANFARDLVRSSDIYQWSGVVTVGGDGIIFEVVNGLFERPDWAEAIQRVPIGVVPGGSGNGLCRSIAYSVKEPYTPTGTLSAALSLVRNITAPLDLVRVETRSQILFSFLSVGWGFLADVDIESERLRMFGGQRFTVWSVARLIGLKTYRGKVWYLPVNDGAPSPRRSEAESTDLDLTSPRTSVTSTPTNTGGRPRRDSWYSATSRRSAYFSTAADSSYRSASPSPYHDARATVDTDPDPRTTMRQQTYGPASRLPCVTAPLPTATGWRCIDGPFVMAYASYISHLSEDCLFVPEARLDDGTIWLVVIRATISRPQLLQFLLGLSSGSHLSADVLAGKSVELLPVRAFRFEPDLAQNGYITVDGEQVEYGPIQGEVFRGLGRVLVP